MLPLLISCAFLFGLLARRLGLPPLVGFLTAGFILGAFGLEPSHELEEVAELGVMLLLFTVGLKMRLQNVLRAEVWGVALLHMALVSLGLGAAIQAVFGLAWEKALVLGLSLGFSSTVLAAKVLEDRNELRAFHGRVAIGILIIQDLVAVVMLSTLEGHAPSPWALSLLALPLVRPLVSLLLDYTGHGEMLVLYGTMLSLAMGGYLFEVVGMSPELGALVMGALLADHPRAQEVAQALWGIKEFLLVAFFLLVGMYTVFSVESLLLALALALVIPLKSALFFQLLVLFRLRARSAFLSSLALASYSEFGLIVGSMAVKDGFLEREWLGHIAFIVALSFVLVAPINRFAHDLYGRMQPRLLPFERTRRHPDDEPVSLGRARIAVVGMGRVGTGAYDFLTARGERVAGLDSDPAKVERHRAMGRRVLYADAEDLDLWRDLDMDGLDAVLLAMPDLDSKRTAIRLLRGRGYPGLVSATNVHPEEAPEIMACGCSTTYNFYDEAGVGFAQHALEALQAGS